MTSIEAITKGRAARWSHVRLAIKQLSGGAEWHQGYRVSLDDDGRTFLRDNNGWLVTRRPAVALRTVLEA